MSEQRSNSCRSKNKPKIKKYWQLSIKTIQKYYFLKQKQLQNHKNQSIEIVNCDRDVYHFKYVR